jgi:hypothetical protein
LKRSQKAAMGTPMLLKAPKAKTHIVVLQDRKRLPARFFAELSGLVTGHIG